MYVNRYIHVRLTVLVTSILDGVFNKRNEQH